MDWRIEKIEYLNFKFFKDSFSLNLSGKNLLLYGENGSGKSSLAMGLYTLLESRKKSEEDVLKYFKVHQGNNEHLRNIYSTPDEHSSISITYKNIVNGNIENRIISDEVVQTQNMNDEFCQNSLSASDVLSYRTLTDLLYRKNSKEVDLFDIFVDDFFLFLDLDEPYQSLDGTIQNPNDLSAATWWKELNKENVVADNIKSFNELIEKFRIKVNNALSIIQEFTNRILHDELGHDEITVSLDLFTTNVDENHLELSRPKLILTAKESNPKLEGWSVSICHLATHFNEARLTCIAIALRMAIAEQRHISSPNINAFLCIDDLLLSLDMGNRIPVVKMILYRALKWQLLILTHDRALYEIFCRLIPESEKSRNWIMKELFVKDFTLSNHDYPEPFMKDRHNYLDSAEEFFKHRDYASCANHLRKYAEEQLKIFLPKNLQLQFNNDLCTTKDLNALIAMLGTYADQLGISRTLFPSIDFYRQRLLNPLSHNDISTPVYRQEIESCFKELKKLPLLIDSTFVLVTSGETDKKKWTIKVSNGGNSDKLTFKAIEPWIYLDYGGTRYIQNVQIEVCHNDSDFFPDHAKGKLKDIFASICLGVGITDPGTMPSALDSISDKDGTLLSAIKGGNFLKLVKKDKM